MNVGRASSLVLASAQGPTNKSLQLLQELGYGVMCQDGKLGSLCVFLQIL